MTRLIGTRRRFATITMKEIVTTDFSPNIMLRMAGPKKAAYGKAAPSANNAELLMVKRNNFLLTTRPSTKITSKAANETRINDKCCVISVLELLTILVKSDAGRAKSSTSSLIPAT
jgi:hypothetical protein